MTVYFSHHCGRSEDFALIDRLAKHAAGKYDDMPYEIIMEQRGNEKPEIVAIWSRHADH